MRKEIVERDEYEDKIDLVDLIKILVKNKTTIILTTIIITALSLGVIFYNRANRVDQYQQNFKLRSYVESYYSEKSNLNMDTFIVTELLNKEEIVEKILSEESFKDYYLKETNGKDLTFLEKQKFIKDKIELITILYDNEKKI